MTLRQIVQALRDTYCGSIGAEFMHGPTRRKALVAERLEKHPRQGQLLGRDKKHILDRLTAAEGLERYLHTKYVGQKRFSLEGGEASSPRWTS